MNGFTTWRNINPKFQLVHPGKLAENQLARSQNLLVTDERTIVKIFTDINYFFLLQVAELLIDPVCRGIFAGSIRELSIKSCFKQLYDYEQKYRSIVLGMLRGSKGG